MTKASQGKALIEASLFFVSSVADRFPSGKRTGFVSLAETIQFERAKNPGFMFLYGAASFGPPKRLSRAWVGNGFVISTDGEQIFQPEDILFLERVSYFGRRRCSSIITWVTQLGKKLQKKSSYFGQKF